MVRSETASREAVLAERIAEPLLYVLGCCSAMRASELALTVERAVRAHPCTRPLATPG